MVCCGVAWAVAVQLDEGFQQPLQHTMAAAAAVVDCPDYALFSPMNVSGHIFIFAAIALFSAFCPLGLEPRPAASFEGILSFSFTPRPAIATAAL